MKTTLTATSLILLFLLSLASPLATVLQETKMQAKLLDAQQPAREMSASTKSYQTRTVLTQAPIRMASGLNFTTAVQWVWT